MVNYDPAKVYFITESTIDEILYESPVISNSYAGGGPSAPLSYNFTVPHTFTTPVIANGMFSIDGSNYYPCGMRLEGAVSGTFFLPQYVLCDMFTTGSDVRIYTDQGFDTTQTVYMYYTLESI